MLNLVHAEEPKIAVEGLLTQYMNEIRSREKVTINSKNIVSAEPETALVALKSFEKDSSPKVREQALALGWLIAKDNKNPEIRQEMTARLVKGLSDPESLVWQHAAQYLLDFNSEDFTETAKEGVHQIFIKGNPEREKYIVRIIGVVDMKEEMARLEKLLTHIPHS